MNYEQFEITRITNMDSICTLEITFFRKVVSNDTDGIINR